MPPKTHQCLGHALNLPAGYSFFLCRSSPRTPSRAGAAVILGGVRGRGRRVGEGGGEGCGLGTASGGGDVVMFPSNAHASAPPPRSSSKKSAKGKTRSKGSNIFKFAFPRSPRSSLLSPAERSSHLSKSFQSPAFGRSRTYQTL